jgi:ParB-like chromosome segregation protein Spo0J
MKIVNRPISQMKAHPKNAKIHTRSQIDRLIFSIKQFGFNNPVLLDGDWTVLAGHGRLEAARQMEMKEVPSIILDHMTPEQARAYVIADNKLADSGWDTEALSDELFELSHIGYEVDKLGFSDEEIDKLMKVSETEQNEVLQDLEAETNEKDLMSPGQIWRFGKHKVHIGGRRLNIDSVLYYLETRSEPVELFLLERQAKSLLTCWIMKKGKDVERLEL